MALALAATDSKADCWDFSDSGDSSSESGLPTFEPEVDPALAKDSASSAHCCTQGQYEQCRQGFVFENKSMALNPLQTEHVFVVFYACAFWKFVCFHSSGMVILFEHNLLS